jgi:hypothetical protein
MKNTTFLLLLSFCFVNLFGQTKADSVSVIYPKYLIMNDLNQVLLVYDKNYDAWEFEGTYYRGSITLKNLLDSITLNLGVKYDNCKLGGIFSYHNPKKYKVFLKQYYIVHFTDYINGKSFKDPSQTKWVSIEEARKIIPYPTMVLILDQLTEQPNKVWGGAFEEYNYKPLTDIKWKVIEPFYELN